MEPSAPPAPTAITFANIGSQNERVWILSARPYTLCAAPTFGRIRSILDPLLRPAKDRLLEPVARRLSGVHPHAVTGCALAAGVSAAIAGWTGSFSVGFLLWVVNRGLDGLDGLIARMYGKTSDAGGYLDLVVDFTVYAAIPVGLALSPSADPELAPAALVLLATFYVNAATWMVLSSLLEKRGRGAEANAEQTAITMPSGLIGGTETVVFYSLFFLLPGQLLQLFWVMGILTGITAIQRSVWGARALSR